MLETEIWPPQRPQDDVRVADITRDLAENRRRVFSAPGGQVDIDVAEVTSNRDRLSGKRDFLEPAWGWSDLPITQDGALRLFQALEVFPNIYRYIKAFRRKVFPRDEGFSGFDSAITLDKNGQWTSFESCYLLKYVGKRKQATPGTNPWSIRNALIYQKTSPDSKFISHLLVRLPESVKQQLSDCLTGEETKPAELIQDWTRLHAACLSIVDDDLRECINYLDEEITKVFDRVIMSGVEPNKLNEFDTVHSTTKDFKTLQYLSDQARRVMNAIKLNMATMKCLQQKIHCLVALWPCPSTNGSSLMALSTLLPKIEQEHGFSLKNVSAVCERAKATSEHLRDTVSLKNSEINTLNTDMANQNTSAIVQLADKSSREAHVVKTLTVLALVFVPASYVADFLQMGFITISEETPLRWSATPDLKIYAILAIPLIATTMLIYGCVEVFQRSKEGSKTVRDCNSV
ncbi:Fc.00g096850.m01.CDS01 [Cosmosporella sp. VM-42]